MPTASSEEKLHAGHDMASYSTEREKILNKIKKRWSDQIEHGGNIADKRKINLMSKNDEIVIHGGYVATNVENPMISENCRTESLVAAVQHWQHEEHLSPEDAFEKSEKHLRSQQEEFSRGITFTQWLKHIAACKLFCNVAVLRLLQCHIESVARHPHDIVLFDFDSHTVAPTSEQDKISRFAAEIDNNPGKNILLLARASQAGTAGKNYNRHLSLLRGQAVQQVLLTKRVPADKIKVQHLGNEEPQLNQWIARLYGMQDIYQQVGPTAINQSVMLVLY